MVTATRPVAPPPAYPRRPSRARTLAAALCGGLAGLVVGAAFVVLAPAVGRASAVDVAQSAAGEGGWGRPHRGHLAEVSAVLLPAIEAGVRPTTIPDGEDGEGARP